MMIAIPKFRWTWLTPILLGLSIGQSAWADEAANDDLTTPPALSAIPTATNNSSSGASLGNDVIVLNPRSDLLQPAAPTKAEKSAKVVNSTKAAKNTSERASEQNKAKKTADSEVSVLGGLYVYVDEMGVPHYSLQKIDERYQLFANAGPVLDSDIKLAVGMPDTNLGRLEVYGYGGASAAVQRRLLNSSNLARYEATIRKHANAHGVDVNLVKAVMAAESGFNSSAISPKNAMGLMQVIPPTAARYGVSAEQLMNPDRNIYAGVRYLRDLSRMFQGRPDLIIAAYNAGEGAVYKYNRRIPPYAETQNYVRTVMQYYQVYSGNSIGSDNLNVKIRNTSSPQKGKVVMTSGHANTDSRRTMQRMDKSAPHKLPIVISN